MKHKIEIVKNNVGNIIIKLNDVAKITIESDHKINGSKIFESLEYSKDKKYELVDLTEEDKNNPVMQEIHNFYTGIINDINKQSV
jgi:hypothetical protein